MVLTRGHERGSRVVGRVLQVDGSQGPPQLGRLRRARRVQAHRDGCYVEVGDAERGYKKLKLGCWCWWGGAAGIRIQGGDGDAGGRVEADMK